MDNETRQHELQVTVGPDGTIRIQIHLDIVLRPGTGPGELAPVKRLSSLGDCPDNVFNFSFDRENAKVLYFSVEKHEISQPPDSGNFTTCITDASDKPSIIVAAMAKEQAPGGRVALQLSFRGKPVFSSPREFAKGENGFLNLNVSAKLPL